MAFYYPIDLGTGRDTTLANQAVYFLHTEKAHPGGYFPVGTNTVWHGGVHVHADPGAEVHACHRGRVVAARLAPVADEDREHYGSRNFILVEHREGARAWYSLYMHLAREPLEASSARLASVPWLWRRSPLPGPSGAAADDGLVYDAAGEVVLGGDLSVQLGFFKVRDFSNDDGQTVRVHRRLIDRCNALREACGSGITVKHTDISGHGVVLHNSGEQNEALYAAAVLLRDEGQLARVELQDRRSYRYVYVSLRTAEEDRRGTGAVDVDLLDRLRAGEVVALDHPVAGDDLLWWVGEYGSPGHRTGLLHWEVFSAENLMATAPGWEVLEDTGDENWNLDQDDLVETIERTIPVGTDDCWLSDEEVTQFYFLDPGGSATKLRTTACHFCSEWAVDLEQAVDDLVAEYPFYKIGLADRVRPYLWWAAAEQAGVDLPLERKVWHYNPIAFLPVDLSAEVLAQARTLTGGGFDADYGTSAAGDGVPEDVVFAGDTLLSRDENGKDGATYCCGYTFWTFFRLAEAQGLLAGKAYDDVLGCQRDFFGYGGGDAERQAAAGVAGIGAGYEVLRDDLKAGDIVQYHRSSGSGHSVVFLRWVVEEGARVGLEYRSSQSTTDGAGDRIERFARAGDRLGEVYEDRLYGGRVTPSVYVDRGPDAPEREVEDGTAQQDTPTPAALLELTGSVGAGGANAPADVQATKEHFARLGFDWLTIDTTCDADLIHVIKLFQSIKSGYGELLGDGRIDVGGDTHQWLNASNAPRWQAVSLEGPGYRNYERLDQDGTYGYGASWMDETLRGAGQRYQDGWRASHADAALIWVNDVALVHGGPNDAHGSHQTGLDVDIRLPRTDGEAGGITVGDDLYDRDAMRAILQAFHAQPLVKQKGDLYLNDAVLQGEDLCVQVDGHDDHLHVRVRNPERGPQTGVGDAPQESAPVDAAPAVEPSTGGVLHVVAPGEYLSLLAQRYGVPSWEDIYYHANNAGFRALRPDPNVIEPGDEVFVPTSGAIA